MFEKVQRVSMSKKEFGNHGIWEGRQMQHGCMNLCMQVIYSGYTLKSIGSVIPRNTYGLHNLDNSSFMQTASRQSRLDYRVEYSHSFGRRESEEGLPGFFKNEKKEEETCCY